MFWPVFPWRNTARGDDNIGRPSRLLCCTGLALGSACLLFRGLGLTLQGLDPALLLFLLLRLRLGFCPDFLLCFQTRSRFFRRGLCLRNILR